MQIKLKQLGEFGKNLQNKASLDEALPYISSSASSLLDADRCSIFINDIKEHQLWTTLADNADRITLPADMGLVGQTVKLQKPILENDPYDNINFFQNIDTQTGYYTQNILTSPIFNSQREVVGVIQLLNKKGGFNKNDIKFVSFFAHYISSYIELRNLIKESNGTY